jgi:hypothetical protein
MERYVFQRGEPIILGDRVVSGTLPVGHSMRARMKRVSANTNVMPGDDVLPVTQPFVSSFVPEAGSIAAHYLHSMSAADSAVLAEGDYLFDSSLLINGAVAETSDPVRITLRNSASGAA